MKWLIKLASLRLTVVLMGLLVGASMLVYGDPQAVSIWVLVVPLGLIAVNLSAAIISNQKINRQPGLLLFHVCLLTLILLAGLGRLIHLDAHLEIRSNEAFSPASMMDVRAGPLHSGNLDQVRFIQGPYQVHYAKGMQRGLTFSHVKVWRNGAWHDQVVGDDRPLLFGNYRLYTTFNKGFSAILTWMPSTGAAVTGALNMPSYPLFDYKQDNSWTPPGSQSEIRFWLRLNTGMDEKADWVLDAEKSSGVLVVNDGQRRIELNYGQQVNLNGGSLRFDGISTWMGYRVFYDPTIQWMFGFAIAGVAGLAHYFWRRLNLQVWSDAASAEAVNDGSVAHSK